MGNDNDCCFFLLFDGVPLEVRKRRDRRSPPSLSFGGLELVTGASPSGSVVVAASFPELSFFQSPLRSNIGKSIDVY